MADPAPTPAAPEPAPTQAPQSDSFLRSGLFESVTPQELPSSMGGVVNAITDTENAPAVDDGTSSPSSEPTGSPAVTPAPSPGDQTQQPSPVLDSLRARGLDVSAFNSDEEILQAFQQAAPAITELPRLREAAAQFYRFAPEIAKLRQPEGGDQQSPGTAPSPEAKPKWEVPEFSPHWEHVLELDPNLGRLVPRKEYDSVDTRLIADKANTYREWYRRSINKLATNPHELFKEVLDSELGNIEDRVRSQVERVLTEREIVESQKRYLNENLGEFYVLDAQGRVVRDVMGNEMMTPKGQVFYGWAQRGSKAGLTGLELREYAERNTRLDMLEAQASQAAAAPTAPTAPPPTPAQVNQSQKDNYLREAIANGGAYAPNRAGTLASAAQPRGPVQNPNGEDIWEQALREAGLLQTTG